MAQYGQIPTDKKCNLVDAIPLESPFTVMISPTDYCNLNCIFCEYHGNVLEKNNQTDKYFMDIDLYKKIIDDLCEFSQQIKLLVFDDYGEPTLHKQLPEMIAYAKKKDVAKSIRLVTNGTLLTIELNNALVKSGLDEIKISVEAVGEEEFFRITGKRISLNKFLENIQDLYENKGNLKIFCKTVDIALKNPHDKKKFIELYNPICDYLSIENVIPHKYHESKEILNSMGILEFPERTILGGEVVDKEVCMHLFYYLAITTTGEVYPCSRGKRSGHLIGNVRDDSLVNIWNSDCLKNVRIKNVLSNPQHVSCKECEFIRYTNFTNLDAYKSDILKKL